MEIRVKPMSNSTNKPRLLLLLTVVALFFNVNAQTKQNSTALELQIIAAQQAAQTLQKQLSPKAATQNNHHGGKMKGMKKMAVMDKNKSMPTMKNIRGMGKQKMMGRQMAGPSNKPSADNLPAFPGNKHLYHIGADSFFLDKTNLISLNTTQQQQLTFIQNNWQQTDKNLDDKLSQAEQALWLLTAEDSPSVELITTEMEKIALLQMKQRLHFIQNVGNAATILTNEQRQILTQQHALRTAK
jgi:hypothetical protein